MNKLSWFITGFLVGNVFMYITLKVLIDVVEWFSIK